MARRLLKDVGGAGEGAAVKAGLVVKGAAGSGGFETSVVAIETELCPFPGAAGFC